MKYEFGFLDEVKMKGVDEVGYVVDRRFSFLGFGNYYMVRIEELVLGEGEPWFDWIEIECPESDLVKSLYWDNHKSIKEVLFDL